MDFNQKRDKAKKYNDNKQFRQKYKEKSKYGEKVQKHSNAQIAQSASKSSISKLPSNWDKYEEDSDQDQSGPTALIDFNSVPPMSTECNHFQFKNEKYSAPIEEHIQGDFFELDLSLINLSLSTIPFYELVGIDKDNFTDSVIENMERSALNSVPIYQSYLEKNKKFNTTDFKTNDLKVLDAETLGGETSDNIKEEEGEQEKVDLITEQLEEWLDNIL